MTSWPAVASLAVFLLAGLAALHIIAPHVGDVQLAGCAILVGWGALLIHASNRGNTSEDEDEDA